MPRRLIPTLFTFAITLVIAGCGRSTEQEKLTPTEEIDWAAIEAEGDAMNEEQKTGE